MTQKKTDRSDALAAAATAIRKQFGDGALQQLDSNARHLGVAETPPGRSSGSLGLDLALGFGGYAHGRLVELFGPTGAGKTTLALCAIAETQKPGGIAAMIDVDHTLDLRYAARLGVSAGHLLVSQPDNAEQALEIAETLARSGAVDLVVIDSLNGLVPAAELSGDLADHVGLQARLMSQSVRKLTAVCARTGATVMFLNRRGPASGTAGFHPETTPCGNALKFYAGQRVELRHVPAHPNNGRPRTYARVVKNKIAPPFREALIPHGVSAVPGIADSGATLGPIDTATELFALGLKARIIDTSGGVESRLMYGLGDQRLGFNPVECGAFLAAPENAAVAAELRARINAHPTVIEIVAGAP